MQLRKIQECPGQLQLCGSGPEWDTDELQDGDGSAGSGDPVGRRSDPEGPREVKLLDCFCGAGGASVGYARAGFTVVGVDIKAQPHYPFEFHQGDALAYVTEHGHEFDVIAGSPPCHDHTKLAYISGYDGSHNLLDAFRALCVASGKPYIIENVIGAQMPGAVVLCGTEFDLHVDTTKGRRYLARHRQFESSIWLWGAGGCSCGGKRGRIIGVYGHGDGGPAQRARGWKGYLRERKIAMGIDWMNRYELAQAIPPVYTTFIGEQMMASLGHVRIQGSELGETGTVLGVGRGSPCGPVAVPAGVPVPIAGRDPLLPAARAVVVGHS